MTEHEHHFRGEPQTCDCGEDFGRWTAAVLAHAVEDLAWHEARYGTREEQERRDAEMAEADAGAREMSTEQVDSELRDAGLDPDEVGRKGEAFMRALFRSMRFREKIAELSAALDERTRERDEAHKPLPCSVCVGTGNPGTGNPCICGGAGTQGAEMDGLRRVAYSAQDLQVGLDAARAEAVALSAHVERLRFCRRLLGRYSVEDAWVAVTYQGVTYCAVSPEIDQPGVSPAAAIRDVCATLAETPAASLAAHDRAVRAEALRDAVGIVHALSETEIGADIPRPAEDALLDAATRLRARAEAAEKEK